MQLHLQVSLPQSRVVGSSEQPQVHQENLVGHVIVPQDSQTLSWYAVPHLLYTLGSTDLSPVLVASTLPEWVCRHFATLMQLSFLRPIRYGDLDGERSVHVQPRAGSSQLVFTRHGPVARGAPYLVRRLNKRLVYTETELSTSRQFSRASRMSPFAYFL